MRRILRGLNVKILSVPMTAFCLGILIPGLIGFMLLRQSADRRTAETAQTLLRALTSEPYYGDALAAKRSDAPGNNGEPANGSTPQAGPRRSDAGGKEASFRYRQVALNPAGPLDRADAYEARLIGAFAKNPQLNQIEDAIQRKDGSYRVAAMPVVVSQDGGLRRNGSVGAAPAWHIQMFGRAAGVGAKKNQVVGVAVVYVPGDEARRQAAQVFWIVFKLVGLLSLLCASALIARVHTLIVRPTQRLMATSEAIRRADWRAHFNVRWPDELADLAISFQNTTLWLREQVAKEEKLRALFQQFVPASVAARALGMDADKILAGTRHSVTVMMINIRNFKLLMEHLPPEQTVTTLNEFFSEVNKVILANKGLVSKYLGDSVMVIFGMPMGDEGHAGQAVRAALAIPAALQNLYLRLDENYGWQLGVGIGISTGEPIVGCFGSTAHMEYTVLGDVVVEAHCLEEATKAVPEEDTILISEATYRYVMSDVYVYDVGEKPGAKGAMIHAYVVQGFRSEARSALAA